MKIVLTADRTLMSKYRNIPLGDFLGCVPSERVPRKIYDFISKVEAPLDNIGTARVAPYGLRKIEAALLQGGFSRNEVVVAHPDYLHNFIGEDTEVVVDYTMDPLGFGPVSMMFTIGHKYTSYNEIEFRSMMNVIMTIKKKRNLSFKTVVSGPGTWQLVYRFDEAKNLGIDHVIQGEGDHVAVEIINKIINNSAPEVINITSWPSVDQIPTIIGASIQGLVEVMRGCGRGCAYCMPNMRVARYIPIEKIVDEAKINVRYGEDIIWLHSEDIFLYKLEDKKNFIPNTEAILELFDAVMNVDGVRYVHPTHCSIAPIVADPNLIPLSSKILRAGNDNWIGIQPGLETGSGELLRKYMANKMRPFSPDEWQDVAIEATVTLNENYWFPAYTLIVGLPGETEDDAWETVRLLERLEYEVPERVGKEKAHFITAPLSFVPLGVLKDRDFFNIEEELNEARFNVIYRAWRIIVKEINRSLKFLVDQPLPIKLLVEFIARVGGKAILRSIEKYGRKRGYLIKPQPTVMNIKAML
ncbi:MAG: B12-binding domain-containing radical SAM protein [Candidatus Asgardarchaeia archaeon]